MTGGLWFFVLLALCLADEPATEEKEKVSVAVTPLAYLELVNGGPTLSMMCAFFRPRAHNSSRYGSQVDDPEHKTLLQKGLTEFESMAWFFKNKQKNLPPAQFLTVDLDTDKNGALVKKIQTIS